MDNKTIEYDGQTANHSIKWTSTWTANQVAKLWDKDRGMATNMGQKFTMTLAITPGEGGPEEAVEVTLNLPYNMDGIAINLPACMAGTSGDVVV